VSPAYITRRETRGGTRYVVRYRMGGRGFAVQHAGSFRTMKEARARRDLVAGELAAGRDPRATLQTVAHTPPARTLAEWADAWAASRRDMAASSHRKLAPHRARIDRALGHLPPAAITPGDINLFVASLDADLKPASVRRYMTTLRSILDFAGADPNPARHRTVRLPQQTREEPDPPSSGHLLAMLDRTPARWRLPITLMEQAAMRVGEIETLVWGDVDLDGDRLRLRSSATKTRRPRWVQVPGWLMDVIADTCPPDDRTPERRVFPGFTATAARNAMARACRAAGIPVYSPHDLRHRRASLWHGQGVPARELASRLGHTKASMSLDVYSHVMPLDEAPRKSLAAALVRSR
jgi:integrase